MFVSKCLLCVVSACLRGSLLECFSFLVLVSLNLGFDGFPLHFDVASVVLHRFVSLFSVVLLQEALSVSDDRINVGLVLHCDLQGTVPSVQLDVQFDCSVEQTVLDQDSFGFRNALLVDEHSSLSGRLTGKFLLDVVDVLDFISLVNLGKSDFNSVEFSAVDTHGCEACPKGALIHKTAKTNDCLEVKFLDVLIQHSRIGRNWKSGKGSIKASH